MKRLVTVLVILPLVALAHGSVAFAASNPNGTGQPSQSCQTEPTGPAALVGTTNGFATKAVKVYAGSPGTESAEANPRARLKIPSPFRRLPTLV